MNGKVKMAAVVGIIGIILTIVVFMGMGRDNPQWSTIVKAVMAGVVASVGVAVIPNSEDKDHE